MLYSTVALQQNLVGSGDIYLSFVMQFTKIAM